MKHTWALLGEMAKGERQQEARGATTPRGRSALLAGGAGRSGGGIRTTCSVREARLWVPKAPENTSAWPLRSGRLGAARGTHGPVRMQGRHRRLALPVAPCTACAMGFWGSSQAFSSAEQQFSNANTRAPPAEGGEVNSQLWGSVEWGEHLSLFLYFILHSIKCLLYTFKYLQVVGH